MLCTNMAGNVAFAMWITCYVMSNPTAFTLKMGIVKNRLPSVLRNKTAQPGGNSFRFSEHSLYHYLRVILEELKYTELFLTTIREFFSVDSDMVQQHALFPESGKRKITDRGLGRWTVVRWKNRCRRTIIIGFLLFVTSCHNFSNITVLNSSQLANSFETFHAVLNIELMFDHQSRWHCWLTLTMPLRLGMKRFRSKLQAQRPEPRENQQPELRLVQIFKSTELRKWWVKYGKTKKFWITPNIHCNQIETHSLKVRILVFLVKY